MGSVGTGTLRARNVDTVRSPPIIPLKEVGHLLLCVGMTDMSVSASALNSDTFRVKGWCYVVYSAPRVEPLFE